MVKKPDVAEKELDKLEKQFDAYEKNIKDLTLDRMNSVPKEETEMQTKLSSKELAKSKDIYLKPKRRIGSKEAFNEKFTAAYEYDKEPVRFIAENKEIIGEQISIWTKPYPGIPAEEWEVPVNKPVWGPRYLAEQIKRKYYHRLKTDNSTINGSDSNATYYGTLVVDTTVARLDAYPAMEEKKMFNKRIF